MLRGFFLAVAMLAPAAVGAAELQCAFEFECIDADGCNATDYTTSYRYDALLAEDAGATRTDVTDTTTGVMAQRDGFKRFVAGDYFGSGIEETLTVTPCGAARLTAWLPDGPMLLIYTGTCEETE